MAAITLAGSCLLLFGPYLIVGTAILRDKPQLFILFLISIVWAYLSSYSVTALLFFHFTQKSKQTPYLWKPWCSSEKENTLSEENRFKVDKDVAVWLFQQIILYLSRTVLFLFLFHYNNYLKRENQLVHHSSYRIAPLSSAIGLGFGAASLLLSSAPILDAALRLGSTGMGTYNIKSFFIIGYDFRVCPFLPVLIHRSFQSFLYSVASMLWGIIHGIGIAAVYNQGMKLSLDRLIGRQGVQMESSSSFLPEQLQRFSEEVKTPQEEVEKSKQSAFELCEDSDGKRKGKNEMDRARENEVNGTSISMELDETMYMKESFRLGSREEIISFDCQLLIGSPCEGDLRWDQAGEKKKLPLHLPEDNGFFRNNSHLGLLLSLSVFIFQLFFTGVTLPLNVRAKYNNGATDCRTLYNPSENGCSLTLSLQLLITVASLLTALWMVRVEYNWGFLS